MSTDENTRPQAENGADPDSGQREDGSPSDGWLDRLKAAVGLRGSSTVREEIAGALASEDTGLSPDERLMLANTLRLRDVKVEDVLVPRADIQAIEIGASLADLLSAFQNSGLSRMPVYRESLDDPVGLVHIKDLTRYIALTAAVSAAAATDDDSEAGNGGEKAVPVFDLGRVDLTKLLSDVDLVRNILFVPPSMPVTALLASMQASRIQLALVIDEYGGTDGLVSLEDIVEMVVGDIEDEHDTEARPMIVPHGEQGFLADARADLDEVAAAIGADLAPVEEAEDVDTIGGLIFTLLGRIPVRGELVAGPGDFEFEILDADARRIKRLRIYRRPPGGARRRVRPTQPGPDSEG